jgi:hypothetical protein
VSWVKWWPPISQRMAETAQRNANGPGLRNIRFERTDAEELALPDASFDAVLCVLGLIYPADRNRADPWRAPAGREGGASGQA